ncbi:MAG: M1 family metallopeptidase [Bacteroidetes bacterium]|nr:M1 family metallopeptidase [Bacteroidota bacterium]MBP6314955.1 M1 family metallopeptidase [Chitinophagaceae bacterium]
MRKPFFLFLFFLTTQVFSQKPYFQQHVDYTIDVRLNDQSHILHAFEKIQYTNHSSDTLKFIFFHLWPNAYKNDRSAFNEQLVENKQTGFYYSKSEQRGFVDSIQFKVNNEEVNISEYNNQSDVVLLELLNPLLPKQSIEISTPFRVVIPEVFSRLGHKDQAYQISQWFPKPAVYDNRGWHPMPYLDQGEFYSEFGNFTVNITLPANYVVAATGDLQNESEKKFIESRMLNKVPELLNQLQENPESDTHYKTITFKQKNVHDFAWFASKQFLVEKSTATLPNNKKTDCWSFFSPKEHSIYDSSSRITAKTIEYLSTHVGEYPYQQASIVAGHLLAGGGMEYPNVTVIGNVESKSILQTVIVHEVGHNWFYGLLGSNERAHPWMDEGINTFYEGQIEQSIKDEKYKTSKKERGFELGTHFLYDLAAKQNTDQPINVAATEFTKTNYGGIVYGKAAKMFAYLNEYLGAALFEQCMKAYYNEWHYKHPYPEDIQAIFEKVSGQNLSWFFDDCIRSTKKIDFAIKKVSTDKEMVSVRIKNRTQYTGPTSVSAFMGDSLLQTQWISYPYDKDITFENGARQFSQIRINHTKNLPELNIHNNYYYKRGLFKKSALRIRAGTSFGLSKYRDLYILPAAGYNIHDKTMLGLVFHNIKIPNNPFQFALAPMISLGTKQVVGTGIIGYSFFPKKIKRLTLAIQGNTFHHQTSDLNISKPVFVRHIKIAPSISIDFAQKTMRSPKADNLLLRYTSVKNQFFSYRLDPTDSLFRPVVNNNNAAYYLNVRFSHKNNRTLNPFSYEINAMGNQYFAKVGLTTKLRIDYHMKNKSLYVRGFAGKFFDFKTSVISQNLTPQYLNATGTEVNDYTYDETFVARNQQKGVLAQQISTEEGGLKIRTNLYANPIGQNNNWLAALNFRTDIPLQAPIKLPLKVQLFMDASTFARADKLNPSGAKLIYDAGVQLNVFGDILVVYVPLLMSKDFSDYGKSIYGKKRFENSISFALNLSKINVLKTQELTRLLGL